MSKENKFAADLARLLKKQGAIVCSYVASSFGLAGFPDKIVISRPWVGFIELKSNDRQLTPRQFVVLREINRRRVWTGVEVREISENSVECEVTMHLPDDCDVPHGHYVVRRDALLEFLGKKVKSAMNE